MKSKRFKIILYKIDDKYGQTMYASGKIPISEVTILRRRKDLPVDRRRKI